MHKRILAVLAIVTTIFAFGVGAAMADHYTPANPHPGCENGKARGCEDGTPGNGDGHDDTGGGGDGEEPSCASFGAVPEPVGPELVAQCTALTEGGGGGEFPPAPPEELPIPPGGGEPSCASFEVVPEPIGPELVAQCTALTEGGGGEVPPAPPEGLPVPPEGSEPPSCASLDQLAGAGVPPEVVTPVKTACETVFAPAA